MRQVAKYLTLPLTAIVLSGCYSPLKRESYVSANDLQRRLRPNWQEPPKPEPYDEIAYFDWSQRPEVTNLSYNHEKTPGTPSLEEAIYVIADEFYFKHLEPGDVLYKPVQTAKKIDKEVKRYTNFNLDGWEIKLDIDLDSAGFRVTKEF